MSETEQRIDLHTHSTASDGSCTPSEIIQKASKLGLSAVALTDHDTVAGIDEFITESQNYPDLQAIPGVEVSANLYGTEVHIVGLFINHHCASLNKLLRETRENRNKRNTEIIAKLNDRGYEITIEDVLNLAGGESVGRPHFAQVLINKGYFNAPQEVFDKCLRKGKSCYSKRRLPTPKMVANEIHNAQGIAIWAHAVFRHHDERNYVKKTIKQLVKAGIDGIETHYTTFKPHQQNLIQEYADLHNLVYSGGSDFHGMVQPQINLGSGYGNLVVPADILRKLQEYRCNKYNLSNSIA